MSGVSQFDASDLPIAERGAPDRTDKAGRRADPCEGQAEFSRSGEAAEKVSAVSASGQEHLGQSERWKVWVCPRHGIRLDDAEFIEGQDPNLANANDPDGWTGVLYCGARDGDEACYEEVRQIIVVPETPSRGRDT